MAIETWTDRVFNKATDRWESVPPRTVDYSVTYEGRVLQTWAADSRPMSDVYATAIYALVWTDEGEAKTILCYYCDFDCATTYGKVTVDAPYEIAQMYENQMAEKARKEREAREREARERVAKGKVVVFKAKTPKGVAPKSGLVFWTRVTASGPAWANGSTLRLGVALSNRKNPDGSYADVEWTTSGRVKVVGSESDAALAAAVAEFNARA